MLAFGWIAGAAALGLAVGALLAIVAGRVRRPPKPFPWPVVAAASVSCAVLFGLVATRFSAPLELAAYLVFAAAAVAASIVDLADHRLPDVIVLPSLATVAALLLVSALVGASLPAAIGVVAGAAAMFGLYLVLALISPRGMGMGDVKLAALIGAATGYLGLTNWLVALAGAFLVGGIVSLVGLATKRVGLKSLVPFGPSMLAGGFVAILTF